MSKAQEQLTPRKQLSINNQKVVDAAKFAIEELQQLSDSGVYKSLFLNKIVKAEEQNGVYHYNIFLTLELSSDYFDSGKSFETFDIIVLKSFEDGVYSFAINEFPKMTENAIEKYWIEMVEEHRKLRESKFLELEAEGLLADAMKDVSSKKKDPNAINLNAEKAKFKQMSTDALREMEKEANSNPATTTIYNYQLYLIRVSDSTKRQLHQNPSIKLVSKFNSLLNVRRSSLHPEPYTL